MYSISSKEFMNLCLSKSASLTYVSKRTWHRSVVNDLGTWVTNIWRYWRKDTERNIPVYVSQSEINESTWICWHQDRSSTEFGIVPLGRGWSEEVYGWHSNIERGSGGIVCGGNWEIWVQDYSSKMVLHDQRGLGMFLLCKEHHAQYIGAEIGRLAVSIGGDKVGEVV